MTRKVPDTTTTTTDKEVKEMTGKLVLRRRKTVIETEKRKVK